MSRQAEGRIDSRGAGKPGERRGGPGAARAAGADGVGALLFLGGVLMVMPFVYMLSTSLKENAEVYQLSLLPRSPTLAELYRRLTAASGFPRWFLNSLVIAVLTTLSVLVFDSLVGYTLAKFRFRGRRLVFLAILSTLIVPTQMLVLPWYVMARISAALDTSGASCFRR